MMIRHEEFAILTHGAGALPHSPGLVGAVLRYLDGHAPKLLSMKVVADVYEEVRSMIQQRHLDALLRKRGPRELLNLVTRSTTTMREAEAILERVWPQPPLEKLEAAALDLLKNRLEYEVVRCEERERLATAGMAMGLAIAHQHLRSLLATR